MEFGIGTDGARCSIFNADSEQIYRCPCCGEELLQKRGKIVIWHFAHKSLDKCVGYYDNKSPWHRSMQDLFPERNREIFNGDYGKHFFDVLTDNGTIVEFQNSPMTIDEFQSRTDAYFSFSIKHRSRNPIWVFNYVSRNFYVYFSGEEGRFVKVRWYRPSKIFGDYAHKLSNCELWFRIAPLRYRPEEYTVFDGEQDVVALDYSVGKREPRYLKVLNIYNGKCVYGDEFSEDEFKKYIQGV